MPSVTSRSSSAAPPDNAETPTATRLRDVLATLLEKYESAQGISRDSYSDTPQWHAMAEAQYLEAVEIARTAGMLSEAQARQRAHAAVGRLLQGALQREVGVYAQWGLGFRWQDFNAYEPFLVTTALVTRCLSVASALVPCHELAQEGLAGLSRFPLCQVRLASEDIRLPVYAPSLSEVVDNTVALWAQVVLCHTGVLNPDAEVIRSAKAAMNWLAVRFVQGLGWAYSNRRSVFDLLHQAYILEAQCSHFGAVAVEHRAIETLAAFRAAAGYIDTLTLAEDSHAIDIVERSSIRYLVYKGDLTLIARAEPARPWSLGGLLACFGLFAGDGCNKGYWLSQIRRFPLHVLPAQFGIDFRQEMHIARGLALALKALRDKSTKQ